VKTFSLIKSYLEDRHQRVNLNERQANHNTYFYCGKIKHHVPQRRIHGPLLFLFYTNDLPKIMNNKSKTFLFADDTSTIINPSAWGHLNPSSYCDVGRLFYGVFKLWSKLQRKK
jgi:hypothetical protein